VNWAFLLNVPYVIVPFFSAWRFLSERPTETLNKKEVYSDLDLVFKEIDGALN
jgi:hypothetical protein